MKITRKKLAIVGAAILVVGAGAFAFYQFRSQDEPAGQPTSPVNYDPPTAEEEADSQARKKANQEQSTQVPTDASGKKQVTPVVTNASQRGEQIFTSAYVPGIVQEGGKCTYNFTKGGTTVTKVTDGFVNVGNTNCTPLTLNRLEFNTAGAWQVTVSYNSSDAAFGWYGV